MTRGHRGSLLLRCRALPSPPPCRFIPAHQPTAHQKTALEWLYPTCGVQGCNCRAYLEIDHRDDWAKTHFTALDFLDRLCKFHHMKKTRDNWALIPGTGKRAFVPPEDPRHPRHQQTHGASR
jgi:hypothetical protein